MAQQNLKFTITAIDKTQKAFRAVGRGLKTVTSAILSVKTGLTALAGAAGFGLLIKSSMQSIDTLGKTASKLGITTQALQKLRFASELAGVETRTVDMAVQRFTRRLSEAANGTGEAKDALKELGLNAKELTKQPLEKQMLELASAFESVENSGDKVRLAFKLFDSEGVAFINTLQGGKEALQEMFNEVDDLGVVLSSSAVKGVEEANDSFTRLMSLFKGVRDSVVGALAPAFQKLTDIIRDRIVQALDEAGGIREFAQRLALDTINLFQKIAEGLNRFVQASSRGVNFLISVAQALGRVLDDELLENLKKLNENYKLVNTDVFITLRNQIKASSVSAEILGDKLTDTVAAFESVESSSRKMLMTMEDARLNGVNALEDALVDVTMRTSSVSEAFKSMANSIIRDLVRMQIQQSITKPLFDFMNAGASSAGSSAAPQAKAIGGHVRAGSPYMVGEGGKPELFVPNQSGTIVPNNKLSGGVVVNQTINLSTGVQQTVRSEVMQMLPQITEATKSAVVDARRRGGSFAAAF